LDCVWMLAQKFAHGSKKYFE